jgi:hypothetical protein
MHRLMTFIAIIIVAIIAGVNFYYSWSAGPPAEGTCYVQSRFVMPDVCVGACEDGDVCKPVITRDYAFGLLEQPYECECIERGKRSGSLGETGTGVTGVVVPPTF